MKKVNRKDPEILYLHLKKNCIFIRFYLDLYYDLISHHPQEKKDPVPLSKLLQKIKRQEERTMILYLSHEIYRKLYRLDEIEDGCEKRLQRYRKEKKITDREIRDLWEEVFETGCLRIELYRIVNELGPRMNPLNQ